MSPPPPGSPIDKKPLALALGCYVLWGLFPIYWKFLAHIPALETLTQRVFWGFLFFLFYLGYRRLRNPHAIEPVTRRDWWLSALAGVLLAANWGLFIYAVNIGKVLETSLAYYINPLMSVAVGVWWFREPFPPLLKLAFILALIGVCIPPLFDGYFPWLALLLAATFCAYGIVKKIVTVGATQFSLMECATMLLPAIALAAYLDRFDPTPFSTQDWILLAAGGIVSSIPLLMFAVAAQRLPYSLMGIIQFVSPSINFLVGIWVFGESLTASGLAMFLFIWAGVGLYLTDRVRVALRLRKASRIPLALPEEPR